MRKLAQELVYWVGLNADIASYVDSCDTCKTMLPSRPDEPLIVHTADHPMQKIGCDLFSWSGKDFLAIVDRFSGFLWIKQLRRTATENVTNALQDIFSDFGYPKEIQSDNGPQFRGPFKDYCREIGAKHMPSSPYNPASNGLAESGVKSAKTLLSKCAEDGTQLSQALHAWRNIPRADGLAPSDLLFGFRQRVPDRPPATRAFSFVDRDQGHKERVTRKQLRFETAGGTPLKHLEQGSSALLQGGNKRWDVPVTVGAASPTGRSYTLTDEEGGNMMRNRHFLRPAIKRT